MLAMNTVRYGLLLLCMLALPTCALAAPQLPLPKHTRLSVVGEDLVVNGQRMQVYELRSTLTKQQLLDFYVAAWPGDTRLAQLPPWTVLSHPDGNELITVQVQALPGDASFGYIGVANVRMSNPRSKRSDLPLMPGGEVLSEIQAQDLGRVSRTLLLRSAASLEQCLAWYEHYYRRRGWRRIHGEGVATNPRGAATLLMNKSGAELNLVAVSERGQVFVTLVQVDATN